jgi:hypothetical protein
MLESGFVEAVRWIIFSAQEQKRPDRKHAARPLNRILQI